MLNASEERFAALESQSFVEYRPKGRTSSSLMAFVKVAVQRRELVQMLVRRDLKSRYKDSALGFAWVAARPLTQLAIYYVVIGHFMQAARGIEDFAIFVFAGLTIFGLFSEIVSSGTGSIVTNSALVKKVALPRELFPLASVGSAGFNFLVQLVILCVALVFLAPPPTWSGIGYAFGAVALVVIFGAAFALALAALNVFFRDTQYLVEVVMLVLMWASPVLYTWSMAAGNLSNRSGLLADVYTSNPLTLAVLGFDKFFWSAGPDSAFPPDLALRMLIAALVGLALFYVAHWQFVRVQGRFAQEI